ncbi:MAG TPA: hypothetical protein VEL74_04965, partial [Thermoanaerobaculia bacterium]|nr:hypothetical protein [Thermoanaerobaculia bacterium]
IGKLFISGFLEATLHRDPAYVRLFRDPRSARAWMPDDLYVSRFQDSTYRRLADYEEDVDVNSASRAGASIDGRGFTLWKEADLPYREGEGTKENQVAYLGWKRKPGRQPAPNQAPHQAPASYALTLPPGLAGEWGLGRGSLLTVSLADTGDEAPDPKDKGAKKEESEAGKKRKEQEEEREKKEKEAREEREKEEGREPLDLTVELVAANGATARLPLSRFRPVPVPMPSRFTKLPEEDDLYGKAVEPILQTFELPLEAFARATPGFDPAALRTVRLVFDRTPEGVVIVDDIGFAEGGERVPGAALGD